MPRITVLPHPELCPEGASIDAKAGGKLCDALDSAGIAIEHACEKACVCTTCHVIIRRGYASMRAPREEEEDQLGKAWGLEAHSRLSCQAAMGNEDLVVEIPRYTVNFAKERH